MNMLTPQYMASPCAYKGRTLEGSLDSFRIFFSTPQLPPPPPFPLPSSPTPRIPPPPWISEAYLYGY